MDRSLLSCALTNLAINSKTHKTRLPQEGSKLQSQGPRLISFAFNANSLIKTFFRLIPEPAIKKF